MPEVVISTTKSQVMTALRAFILSIVPCEVVQGLNNRVPMPKGDFIALTPIMLPALATNVSTFDPDRGEKTIHRSTRYDVQVDCYGTTAADRAALLAMMLRSEYACDSLAASSGCVQPLYADEPGQLPFVNAEGQFEERWSFSVALQFNPAITLPQDSATEISVHVENVDATFSA